MNEEIKKLLSQIAIRIVNWSTDWSVDKYDFLNSEEKEFLFYEIISYWKKKNV